MLTTLFKKQIGMGSSSDSNDRFSRFLVNQKPVGFEMKFPMKFPIALQRMIAKYGVKRFLLNKSAKNFFKFFKILASFLCKIQVFREKLSGIKSQHLLARSLKNAETLSWCITSPRSAALIASMVSLLGISVENGSCLSATRRSRVIRMRSEKFNPIEDRISEASLLSCLLTRTRIESSQIVVGI